MINEMQLSRSTEVQRKCTNASVQVGPNVYMLGNVHTYIQRTETVSERNWNDMLPALSTICPTRGELEMPDVSQGF